MRTLRQQSVWMVLLAITTCLGTRAHAADLAGVSPALDQGFRLLYDLNFSRAQEVFNSWQKQHPADPMGAVGEASGLLFSEFNRLGVLEAQFYEDDKTFLGRKKLTPDAAVRDRFNAKLDDAERQAKAILARNEKDRDALFAMTLSSGLRADYSALIDKSNFSALRYTKEATVWADKLIAIEPDNYDARLATGISKYIVGSMAAPVRWVLRLGGVAGDKKAGIAELEQTAQRGKYLAPFARILLAIAYVRDKDPGRARGLLTSLRDEFPNNTLFPREIARLDAAH